LDTPTEIAERKAVMAKWTKWEQLSGKTREEIETAREKKLSAARARLASGVEALLKGDRWKNFLQFSLKFQRYSFGNTFLIMLQRPNATCVASFKTWKSMGRHVLKNEHGIEIFVPMLTNRAHQAAEGKLPIDPATEEEPAESAGKIMLGFKIGHVFDVSQTEGDPLPERPYALLEGDDGGLFTVLKAAVEALLKIPVTFSTLPSGMLGCCRYDPGLNSDPIAILLSNDPTLSGPQILDTLAHEAGHAMLHSGLEVHQHSARSIRELEAESVAFCILSAMGIDSSPVSFGYIATWAESGGAGAIKEIVGSGQRILDASRTIIRWIEENGGIPVKLETFAREQELAHI
jgi:hypothetical protein